jgi:hypothetical protein
MYKEIIIKNKSTELFYDLAERSFDASWKHMQEACNEDISHHIDDEDFIVPFIKQVIAHIHKNFNVFTKQEGNSGNIHEVNF